METELSEMRPKPKPGIYILPSAMTTGNIFCGFYAVTASVAGDFNTAAVAIGIAIILDGVDGRIARLTGTTSKFGLQLDSLADAISFGLAPAVVLWQWHLQEFGYLGWIACFMYMVCGVMRLARFNVQSPELKHFLGMPIPAAAGVLAALTHFVEKYKDLTFFKSIGFSYALIGLAVVLGALMISTFRYPSFKNLSFGSGSSYRNILSLALLIAGIWFLSHEVLFVLAAIYFFSGPWGTVRRYLSRKPAQPGLPEEKQVANENV